VIVTLSMSKGAWREGNFLRRVLMKEFSVKNEGVVKEKKGLRRLIS
jgi:hypothetical protein